MSQRGSRNSQPIGLLCGTLCAAVLWLCTGAATAAIELSFAVDDIVGEGWSARGVRLALSERTPDQLGVTIEIDALSLPDDHGTLTRLRLACPQAVREGGAWHCADGSLAVGDSPVGAQDAVWQGGYAADQWRIEVSRLAVAQGSLALEIGRSDGAWTLLAKPQGNALMPLAALAGGLGLPADWDIQGRIGGRVSARLAAGERVDVNANLTFDGLRYASPDGRQAAENLRLGLTASGRLRAGAWAFDLGLDWPRGALYAEPLYIDAGDGAVRAAAAGQWHAARGELLFDSWSVALAQTAELSGTGRLNGMPPTIDDLTVVMRSDDAGRLYRRVLQPFLIGTPADDLDVTGRLGLVLHLARGGIEQAGLELSGLTLTDRQGRYALGRTEGSIGWDRARAAPVSHLSVEHASVLRIPAGPFAIRARFTDERIDLLEPVVVSVLGGAVALDGFVLKGALLAGATPRWEASASVRDLSLEELTRILEWPPFGGTVSGQLRNVRYADGLFSVGGGLALSAFGGRIQVDDLMIQEPFGTVPVLRADATLRGLDLLALTRTFAFGRIEGRLDGDLQDIELVGWQPDRFDLHLYTPRDDDSRHRISQRAVENLTELGSGVPAGLSAGLLSLFEEFNYDRIDLRIVLQGDVAAIDGLARPDGGYYLVKGAGLPRIDVIGRNRSVAWKDLVERLRQIQVEGAQIQ